MIRNSQIWSKPVRIEPDTMTTTIEPAVKQTYGRNLESSLNFVSSPVN